MKLNLYPNWKCKEKIFSWFFKYKPYKDFKALGVKFISHIQTFQRDSILSELQKHLASNNEVYVISASISEWIKPYCETIGVKHILATEIEIDANGLITGSFLTKNCYGQEKVNRLLSIEPNRNDYYLIAYGDSKGDKEILSFADQSYYV